MNNISTLLSSLIILFSSPINPVEVEYYRNKLNHAIVENNIVSYHASTDEEKMAIYNINGYLLNARGYFDTCNRPKSTSDGLWFYDGGIFHWHPYFNGRSVKESFIRKRVRERLRQALKLANIYGF